MRKKDKRFGLSEKPKVNRSGQKFYRWTLLKMSHAKRYAAKTGKNKGHRTVVWFYLCQCECGLMGTVSWPDIRSGKSTQCRKCSLNQYLINSQEGIKRFGKENSNYRGSEDVPGRWFSRAKSNASVRSLDFKITLQDLQAQWVKQKGLCFYTGIPLKFSNRETVQDTNNHISLTASLDRVDSQLGYFSDNIVWVSKTINTLKMDLSHDLFVKACELVYIYNKGKKNEQ
jgi:hypothetical protein